MTSCHCESAQAAAVLDYELGRLIRESYAWDRLDHDQRMTYVREFIRIRGKLGRVLGTATPRYYPPWTERERDRYGWDLVSSDPPIVTASRVYERILGKLCRPPLTLNVKAIPGVRLDDVPHSMTVAELAKWYRQHLTTPTSTTNKGPGKWANAETERGWIAAAEWRIRPR